LGLICRNGNITIALVTLLCFKDTHVQEIMDDKV
jgi:uncharacterized membrane protein (DUF441 family)